MTKEEFINKYTDDIPPNSCEYTPVREEMLLDLEKVINASKNLELNISDISDSDYTHVAIPLKDLNDRISSIEKQMEILKDNKNYEYALSKMYSLLIELRYTYYKISL